MPELPASRFFSLPARAASGLLWLYQKTVSPALAALNPTCGCRFAPTCSQYSRDALIEHGLFVGLILTARRLIKCGPWHPGGEDPVPARSRRVCTKVSSVNFLLHGQKEHNHRRAASGRCNGELLH